MSDAPAEPPADPPVKQPTMRAASTRLGPLPIWLWMLLAVIVGVSLIILGLTLLAHGGAPPSIGSPSPTVPTALPGR